MVISPGAIVDEALLTLDPHHRAGGRKKRR
jgi:hypothetical protein